MVSGLSQLAGPKHIFRNQFLDNCRFLFAEVFVFHLPFFADAHGCVFQKAAIGCQIGDRRRAILRPQQLLVSGHEGGELHRLQLSLSQQDDNDRQRRKIPRVGHGGVVRHFLKGRKGSPDHIARRRETQVRPVVGRAVGPRRLPVSRAPRRRPPARDERQRRGLVAGSNRGQP